MPKIKQPVRADDHDPPSVEFLHEIAPNWTFGTKARFGAKWNFKILNGGMCRVTLEADRDGNGLAIAPIEVELFTLTTRQQVREFCEFIGIRLED